ncbi:cytochrome d ubiquinol oxidase subunit II [Cellulomonas sp. C5510]|uniref:cytochrome d ubiquinol oxidase subunit II n=1 Tax=Cellulomonas sp. C5510 TaxID=2871170 RepID=UPI001C95C0EB|nr:cytochrome d ubiquinol oxidase subunit II [Cellulomonas sp. C5510]QZN87046.1 cytochrome d ubiquinol oxidase subunit II [Cellulomonas sp. C5510]
MDLAVVWFGLIVVCWVLFLVLEGFDFGVGILAPALGRDGAQRGAALRTIAPVWDGNEVWLVAAIGLMFAAFPDWYAAFLSGLYLPMVALLLALAVRGVSLEFRGKKDSAAWRRGCDIALAASSALTAALLGATLGVLTGGLALGPDGEVAASGGALGRTLSALAQPAALTGALIGLSAAVVLGATYLGLRTTGPVRERARAWVAAPALALGATALVSGLTGAWPWWAGLLAAGLLALVVLAARRRREGWAFALAVGVVGATVAGVLLHRFPVLLASTLDPAWSVTVENAVASPTALQTISWAAVLILPGVLAYQAFAYWVFRKRVASEPVPT